MWNIFIVGYYLVKKMEIELLEKWMKLEYIMLSKISRIQISFESFFLCIEYSIEGGKEMRVRGIYRDIEG